MRKRMLWRTVLWLAVPLALITGCQHAMSQPTDPTHWKVAPTPWPLRFKGPHAFAAYCYNTLRCRVIYNNHLFARTSLETPTPAPYGPDYQKSWHAGYLVMNDYGFPPAAEVEWTSSDGVAHTAKVDIDAIFKDRLVLHKVPREEIPEGWAYDEFDSPDIFLEVNGSTINVYMKAHIATKTLQIPGNQYSDFRDDVMLAWTHSY